MWGLFYFIRNDVNVLRLEEKKLQLLTWQFSIGVILLLHEVTNTTFIITLVTITTYRLLLGKKKKVKYFVFLNLLILWRPVHSSL